jgi:septum formation protein
MTVAATVTATVRFTTLDDARIAWYLDTGEWGDKAGAYAIQGAGGALVARVDGSVSGIVGLPLAELASLCEQVGFPLF